MPDRLSLDDFAVANPLYAGVSVSVWEVDGDLAKTNTLAALYANPTGGTRLGNPVRLDSRGRWPHPVYVDRAVVMTWRRPITIFD